MWTGRLSGGVPVLSGRIHYLVDSSCVPCHTIFLLYEIKKISLSYDTLQPASHTILMETKEVWARPGTACARMAALGGHGRYKLPVCVDFYVVPSGKFMTRGRVSGRIFLSGDPVRIKCPVYPESSMAWLNSIFILGVLNRVSFFGDSML